MDLGYNRSEVIMGDPANYFEPFDWSSRTMRMRLDTDEEKQEKLVADSDGAVVYIRRKRESIELNERRETEPG
ncbi:MAG: hypothetical protein ACRDTR_02750 [Rubrobacter sp.]